MRSDFIHNNKALEWEQDNEMGIEWVLWGFIVIGISDKEAVVCGLMNQNHFNDSFCYCLSRGRGLKFI